LEKEEFKMKRKALGVLIVLIMIIGYLPSTISIKSNQDISRDNKILSSRLLLEYPVMDEVITFPEEIIGEPYPIIDNIPDEFSWRNHEGKDWTTPAKHQGQCGSCWAFAALGVLESMVEIREGNADLNPDFSEQYLLSCLSEAGSCRGGRAWVALELLKDDSPEGNNANGTIFEECFPYEADDDIPCSEKCPDWMDQLVPILDCGAWEVDGTSNDRKSMKSYIYENGPLVTHIRVTDLFKAFGAIIHNPNLYYPRFRKSYTINHVVMIVGWKDIPFIPSGGYWICKNSWGTEWGYDGFFNIAYGSLNIDGSLVVWADYDPDSFDFPPIKDKGNSNKIIEIRSIFDPTSHFK
jgi:C1A family cysteine protease